MCFWCNRCEMRNDATGRRETSNRPFLVSMFSGPGCRGLPSVLAQAVRLVSQTMALLNQMMLQADNQVPKGRGFRGIFGMRQFQVWKGEAGLSHDIAAMTPEQKAGWYRGHRKKLALTPEGCHQKVFSPFLTPRLGDEGCGPKEVFSSCI